jgi:hypothetical protein
MTQILALQELETDDAENAMSLSTLSWSHCGGEK